MDSLQTLHGPISVEYEFYISKINSRQLRVLAKVIFKLVSDLKKFLVVSAHGYILVRETTWHLTCGLQVFTQQLLVNAEA